MGTLNLPSSGPVYLDTNIIIYSVEKIEPYWTFLKPLWNAAQQGQFGLTSSELVILETLVKPRKDADHVLESTFRQILCASREMMLLPIDMKILDHGASLRAIHGLKSPDAIHAATGLSAACTLFLTNDPAFKRINQLPVVVLRDII